MFQKCILIILSWKAVLDQIFLTGPLLMGFSPFMSWYEGKEDITAELKEKILMTE